MTPLARVIVTADFALGTSYDVEIPQMPTIPSGLGDLILANRMRPHLIGRPEHSS